MEENLNILTQEKNALLLKSLCNFEIRLETDVVEQYMNERQKSGEDPNTCENELKRRKSVETETVSQDNLDNSLSTSTGDNQDILDTGLCKGLVDSKHVTSQESEVASITLTPVTSNYVSQNIKQMFDNISNSVKFTNSELDFIFGCPSPSSIDWFTRPEVSKNASLWRLLWYFGLKFQNDIKRRNRPVDYVNQICNLINLEDFEEPKNSNWYLVNDYQIVTPDGKIWLQKEIRDIAKANIRKRGAKQLFCGFKGCNKCPYKSVSAPKETLVGHIIREMNASYHCVPCGEVYGSKSRIREHAKSCPLTLIKTKQHDGSWQFFKPQMKRKAKTIVCKALIGSLTKEDFGTEFFRWITELLISIQDEGYLKDKTKEELMDSIREDKDLNFVRFFRQMNEMHPSKNKFKVHQLDNYYSILYPTINQKDPSKSAMFRIIEVASKKAISVHQLAEIKDNSFVLIACVGCEDGFNYFDDFEKHLNDDCFIERKSYNPKSAWNSFNA